MSAVFLLGAGASFGSGECYPSAPPLGGGLFADLRRRGGVASTIQPPLLQLFQRNFEEGMAAFREERDSDSTAFLREMAAYLAEFAPGPRNLYHRLIQIVRKSHRQTVLATTNYDLLLEQAITQAGLMTAYSGRPVPQNNISVLKIHGSSNFLPDLGTNRIIGAKFAGNGANVEAPIAIAQSIQEIRAFCSKEDSLAPAIAVYAPGKAVLFCPSFVQDQQRQWVSEVERATVVYVIGLRVIRHDDHIWRVLASSKARLHYVGLEPHEFQEWAAEARRRNTNVLGGTLEKALPLIGIQMRH